MNGNKFELELLQVGPYFKESTVLKDNFSEVNGYYSIAFVPTQDTRYIKVKIKNPFHSTIKIDDFFINGERQIVDYKYIPSKIGHFFSKLYLDGRSMPQRVYMYQDSLKIASDSPIIGNGGNTWKNVSRAVEEYKIAMKECHSYFFELLISYGIIGVIMFFILVISFFVKIFKQCIKNKNKRKEKLLIVLGIFILVLHCMVDFDMSFMLIQLIFYIIMAVLLYDEQKIENTKTDITNNVKKYVIVDYILIGFMIFILSLYIRMDISEYIIEDPIEKSNVSPFNKTYYYNKIVRSVNNKENHKEVLNEIQDFIMKEKYNSSITETYEKYFNIIIENINEFSTQELNTYLNFGINCLNNIRFKTPLYYNTVLKRARMIANTINKCKMYCRNTYEMYETFDDNSNVVNTKGYLFNEKYEIIEKTIENLKQILNKEYQGNIKNIEDYDKTGESEEERKENIEQYNKIIDSIK